MAEVGREQPNQVGPVNDAFTLARFSQGGIGNTGIGQWGLR